MRREYALYTSEWNDRQGTVWTGSMILNSLRAAREWAAYVLEKNPRLEIAELGVYDPNSELTYMVDVVYSKLSAPKRKRKGASKS